MSEFEVLRDKIAVEFDFELFDEAWKCFESGATRSAYIMIWICAAESLKNKFEVISKRDGEIKKFISNINEFYQQGKPTDKLLLGEALDYGLISPDEHQKLLHIYTMRSIYAHPTGSGPSEEELKAAFSIVANTVLRKPPLLRYGYVDALVHKIFNNPNFLFDSTSDNCKFAEGLVLQLHPDVLPYLFVKVVKQLEPIIHDPDFGAIVSKAIDFVQELILIASPDVRSEEWGIVELINQYPESNRHIFSYEAIWGYLPEQGQNMIFGAYVKPFKEGKILSPTSDGLKSALNLKTFGHLTSEQEIQLSDAILSSPYETLRHAQIPLIEYVEKIIEDLKSHNWYKQNPACDVIKDLGPDEIANLDSSLQEELGRNVLQSADGEANKAIYLLSYVCRNIDLWPKYFIKGVLLETLVNNEGKFRLKEDHFSTALKVAIEHKSGDELFEKLIEDIKDSEPKWELSYHYETAKRLVDELMNKTNDDQVCSYLSDLSKAISESEPELPDD